MSGTTLELTMEKIIKQYAIETQCELKVWSLPLGAIYGFSDLVRMKKYFHLGLWQKNL